MSMIQRTSWGIEVERYTVGKTIANSNKPWTSVEVLLSHPALNAVDQIRRCRAPVAGQGLREDRAESELEGAEES